MEYGSWTKGGGGLEKKEGAVMHTFDKALSFVERCLSQ